MPLELGYGAEAVLLVSAGLVFVGAGFMLAYILLSEKIFTERFFAAQKQRLEAAQQEAHAAVAQVEAERQAKHENEVAQVAAAQAEAKQ